MIIDNIDNVEINLENGHKYARRDIKKGEDIIKYGFPIGHATYDIKQGEHVHTHNVKTNLSDQIEYEFSGDFPYEITSSKKTFMGYLRENGDIGIRNDIWIVNTVGCVNKTAQILSEKTGAKHFPHPFGCSQLGEDFKTTRIILKSMVHHPNAGGVLVLGLGCENNLISSFKEILGDIDERRVKFLNIKYHRKDHRAALCFGINVTREVVLNDIFELCPIDTVFIECIVDRIVSDTAKLGYKLFRFAHINKSARDDFGARNEKSLVERNRCNDNDNSFFGKVLSVAQNDVSDVTDTRTVNEEYSAGEISVEFRAFCRYFENFSVFCDEY